MQIGPFMIGNVLFFSDEMKMNMFNSDGRSWCWITYGEHVPPQHVQQTMKHGGGHIIIWGCMATFGLGVWHRIEGMMDQHVYKFILENFLWSTIRHYNLVPSNVVFQHDNNKKHTRKRVQEWLKLQLFQLLQWPAQSLDLKLMEHFWALLKRRLNEYSIPPRGTKELWERVCIVSSNFSEEDCMALYESMS